MCISSVPHCNTSLPKCVLSIYIQCTLIHNIIAPHYVPPLCTLLCSPQCTPIVYSALYTPILHRHSKNPMSNSTSCAYCVHPSVYPKIILSVYPSMCTHCSPHCVFHYQHPPCTHTVHPHCSPRLWNPTVHLHSVPLLFTPLFTPTVDPHCSPPFCTPTVHPTAHPTAHLSRTPAEDHNIERHCKPITRYPHCKPQYAPLSRVPYVYPHCVRQREFLSTTFCLSFFEALHLWPSTQGRLDY